MISLSPRLKCAADMVRKNRNTVDIGTDHAYLPVYLVQNGITGRVLACDIGEKPLENAKKTVSLCYLEDKISLRISDGLKNVNPCEAEEILICGMGGTLISEILSAAPFIKTPGVHLILQPMTHCEDVRLFLCKNGFSVTQEKCAADAGRLYCCISAEYTGRACLPDCGYHYFGSLMQQGENELIFAEKQYKKICKRLSALTKAGIEGDETERLAQAKTYYETRRKI